VDTHFPYSFPDVAAQAHPLGQILGVRGSDAAQGQERTFVKLVVERWRAASGGPRSIADEPTAAEMEARAEALPGPTHDRSEPDVPSRSPPTSAFSRIEQIRAQMLRRGRSSNA
jgi:hypothetical protein